MKNYVLPFIISIFCLSITSCSKSDEPKLIEGINAIVPPSASFAPDDGAKALSKNPAEKVMDLLTNAGPKIIKSMGQMNITDSQYQEIKTFVDKLVADQKTPYDIYRTIFTWITQNIQYASDYVDNDPYPVFQTKKAICQGYANLLNVMLHSQNIPCMNANGWLNPVGGHAWNYVFLDDWYVSDPTNNGHFKMTDLSKYAHLVPLSLDVDLFEDERYIYHYTEERLTLREVKKGERQLVVPFSVNGFQVESFNPNTALPSVIEEIYIGKNINSLGENLCGLEQYAPSVKHAYVDPSNPHMESYGQVVYRSYPYYIPAAATIIQIKPMRTIGKGFFYNHSKVETIIIQPGTEIVGEYAIENCPNLKVAYIPEETQVLEKSFYGVHPSFQIIRGVVGN